MAKYNGPELVFAPLGGVGEIGMNLALYGFGPPDGREWMIVDCGVSFAGPDLPAPCGLARSVIGRTPFCADNCVLAPLDPLRGGRTAPERRRGRAWA